MQEGRDCQKTFEKLVDVLGSGNADKIPSQGGLPQHNEEAFTAVVQQKGAKASPAGPARSPGVDGSRLRDASSH